MLIEVIFEIVVINMDYFKSWPFGLSEYSSYSQGHYDVNHFINNPLIEDR